MNWQTNEKGRKKTDTERERYQETDGQRDEAFIKHCLCEHSEAIQQVEQNSSDYLENKKSSR